MHMHSGVIATIVAQCWSYQVTKFPYTRIFSVAQSVECWSVVLRVVGSNLGVANCVCPCVSVVPYPHILAYLCWPDSRGLKP
jgi:hypothetical protein